ncbi:MAG: hypothetical protein FWC89_08735 [Defluviitaleaceae bacterium]|nr:hypothetical protein [Defluviitaleaceae bacterium]
MHKKILCILALLPLLAACGFAVVTVTDEDVIYERVEVIYENALDYIQEENLGEVQPRGWFPPYIPREEWDFANAPTVDVEPVGNRVKIVEDVQASRTSIKFALENTSVGKTSARVNSGLAYYFEGEWLSVVHLTGRFAEGRGGLMAESLPPSGRVMHYHYHWDFLYGELPNGRYALVITEVFGVAGEFPTIERVVLEFTITEDSPRGFPFRMQTGRPVDMEVVGHSNVTPTEITLTVQNNSAYDFNGFAFPWVIATEETAQQFDCLWELHRYSDLPRLPWEVVADAVITRPPDDRTNDILLSSGHGDLSADWFLMYGELESGAYRLVVTIQGYEVSEVFPRELVSGGWHVISFYVE